MFHFVTEDIAATLERAKLSANGRDVRLGGGVSTVRQYLKAGLIDEMHIAISPVILGSGERLFEDIDLKRLGYMLVEHAHTEKAMHVIISREERRAPVKRGPPMTLIKNR